MDRDREALMAVSERIKDSRLRLLHSSFSGMESTVRDGGYNAFDGILMDLGVSMTQMKSGERGFSFSTDAPLDMRMDRDASLTAGEIVNTWSQQQLEEIFRDFGEEKRARRIARTIVEARKKQKITTCRELADLVSGVSGRSGRIHPATRIFQALRIAVNNELTELEEGLNQAFSLLAVGGRLCVISYHSLEDRIVKNRFRDWDREGLAKRLNKKPVTPSPEEIRRNPASRSGKLRGVERL
jgi:16S rRNA (cytosine1402-N4)-methyltransferase